MYSFISNKLSSFLTSPLILQSVQMRHSPPAHSQTKNLSITKPFSHVSPLSAFLLVFESFVANGLESCLLQARQIRAKCITQQPRVERCTHKSHRRYTWVLTWVFACTHGAGVCGSKDRHRFICLIYYTHQAVCGFSFFFTAFIRQPWFVFLLERQKLVSEPYIIDKFLFDKLCGQHVRRIYMRGEINIDDSSESID